MTNIYTVSPTMVFTFRTGFTNFDSPTVREHEGSFNPALLGFSAHTALFFGGFPIYRDSRIRIHFSALATMLGRRLHAHCLFGSADAGANSPDVTRFGQATTFAPIVKTPPGWAMPPAAMTFAQTLRGSF